MVDSSSSRGGSRGAASDSSSSDSRACSRCHKSRKQVEFRREGYNTCRDCENEAKRLRRALRRAPEVDTTPVLPASAPLQVGLLIPDCHVPNHDERALGLLLQVAHALKPKHIAILGDFADADALSAHGRTKPGEASFEQEVAEINGILDHLDSVGATNKIYIEGNHEFRLDRYLMERAPEMFYAIKWPQLLKLHERGWQWVPYRKSTKIGKLNLTHDTGTAGINAHRTSAQAFGGSAVIGHTHRMSIEVKGRFDGTPYLAAMLGWLGDAEKAASYMHEAKASDWVHGFGVFYMEPDTGIVHLQPVPIVNGKCVVNGKLYK